MLAVRGWRVWLVFRDVYIQDGLSVLPGQHRQCLVEGLLRLLSAPLYPLFDLLAPSVAHLDAEVGADKGSYDPSDGCEHGGYDRGVSAAEAHHDGADHAHDDEPANGIDTVPGELAVSRSAPPLGHQAPLLRTCVASFAKNILVSSSKAADDESRVIPCEVRRILLLGIWVKRRKTL
jgi:hypothetical protein